MLKRIEEKIVAGGEISPEDAAYVSSIPGPEVFDLFAAANRIRNLFRGNRIDICAIVNAKSGACPEDCAYCSQSSRSSSEVPVFPLADKEVVLEKAAEAKRGGAKRFCIVTSGRKVTHAEIRKIADMVSGVRAMGLLPCATLGLLNRAELLLLKNAGLERFHHNIETSERFFPNICTTHTYRQKLETITAVKSVGLSLCSGGILGLGETWQDRIDIGMALREIGPDSVPLNFLIPIRGTRLESRNPLESVEALKIISLFRFLLPGREVRVCGGRAQTLGQFNSFVFLAGADGILSGNYLTTSGRCFEDDIRLIRQQGFEISGTTS
ncbi:Biotin synthase [Candidatus Sulfobium mesophilum]|uniref:Biotin synthase n=1 Tax=Candidatus Sulfobium mesophilum TaxID=2016548 RepID=A0A2U3QIG8_9BACT|nr:Biotin synthase [Candidatus Sulfobium mesophilum]